LGGINGHHLDTTHPVEHDREMAMDDTVTVTWPWACPALAVTVVAPKPAPVSNPESETVATVRLSLDR